MTGVLLNLALCQPYGIGGGAGAGPATRGVLSPPSVGHTDSQNDE